MTRSAAADVKTDFGDTVNSKLVLELANRPATSGSVATQTRLLEYQVPDVRAISLDSTRDARIVNPGIVNPELHTKYAEVFNFKQVAGYGQQLERPRPLRAPPNRGRRRHRLTRQETLPDIRRADRVEPRQGVV